MRSSIFLSGLALLTGASSTPQNVPPTISGNVTFLGHTRDAYFGTGEAGNPNDPGFYSDGGAGGHVNGYNLLTMSDARSINYSNSAFTPQVHTVYAYAGTKGKDPTKITIIANYTEQPHFYYVGSDGSGVISPTPSDACQGISFGPGPNTAMVPLNNGTASAGATVWTIYCGGSPVYNTLIEFNVIDPRTLNQEGQNIPAQRTVLKLFRASQPLYGTDGLASDDSYLYLVAADPNYSGFKLARVLIASRTIRSEYQYYNPQTRQWVSERPAQNDLSMNFFNGTNLGGGNSFGSDLFFSAYFNTWLFSYTGGDVYSATYYELAYSTSGNVQGPYRDLGAVYKPAVDEGCDPSSPQHIAAANGTGVYLTHSHPGFDTSGKTLIIGWVSCNTVIDMANITFA